MSDREELEGGEDGEEDEAVKAERERRERVSALIQSIAGGIGFKAELTNAEWGARFAECLYATNDADAIKHVIADGAEGYRSKFLSATRSQARSAAQAIARKGGDAKPDEPLMAIQLAFEVCAPGKAPVPLRDATHELLSAAYHANDRRIQGELQNNLQIKRAMDATAKFPGQTVGDLLKARRIKLEDLAV